MSTVNTNYNGANYSTLNNGWNANNFMKNYEQVNNPYFPFVYGNPDGYATNTNPNPFFWGQSPSPRYCSCGKSLLTHQLSEGMCSSCGGTGSGGAGSGGGHYDTNAKDIRQDDDLSLAISTGNQNAKSSDNKALDKVQKSLVANDDLDLHEDGYWGAGNIATQDQKRNIAHLQQRQQQRNTLLSEASCTGQSAGWCNAGENFDNLDNLMENYTPRYNDSINHSVPYPTQDNYNIGLGLPAPGERSQPYYMAELPSKHSEIGDFTPSEKFTGSQQGRVFKNGQKGLGYYIDKNQNVEQHNVIQPIDNITQQGIKNDPLNNMSYCNATRGGKKLAF